MFFEDGKWISVAELPYPPECGNPKCYGPEQACNGCVKFGKGTKVVLSDDGEQKFVIEADFCDDGWYSMTGHKVANVTHWKDVGYPEPFLLE